jgi:hypothetical protein
MDPEDASPTQVKWLPSRKARSEYRQLGSLASPPSLRFSTLPGSDKHLGILPAVSLLI